MVLAYKCLAGNNHFFTGVDPGNNPVTTTSIGGRSDGADQVAAFRKAVRFFSADSHTVYFLL